MKQKFLFGVFAGWMMVCMLLMGNNPSKKIQVSGDIFLEQLSENVCLHETFGTLPGIGRFGANGLVVISGEEAILIDTPWDDKLTAELCDWFLANRGVTVTYVVGGHSHSDCLGGLSEMHRRGVKSYGYRLTADIARKKKHPVPQNTFNESMTIHLGEKELVFRYCGPGHTMDNIVVWIPDEKILFGGCLVKASNWNHLGFMGEGDLEGYPGTLKKVLGSFPEAKIVVPGHGHWGGEELLIHTLEVANRLLAEKRK